MTIMRKVEVVPHDPAWARSFQAEAAWLEPVFGDNLIAIHHIGSTAIPGIHAKPIIDLLPEVRDLERVAAIEPLMRALGYEPKGENGIPGRRYFVKGAGERRIYHVHAFQTGNPEIARHLNFCSYLRAHPADAQAYSELKQTLAPQFVTDVTGYTEGKSDLIRQLDGKAAAWRAQQRDNVHYQIDAMQPADWAQVRAIYLQGIATGNATFETEAPPWEKWNASKLSHSRLVARATEGVIGWAAISPVSTRPVYTGVAEESIYIEEKVRGCGVGYALLKTLIETSEANGIWTLQTGIFPENQASILVHKRCGFRILGRRERIGQMHGVWRDVIFLERRSQVVG